MASVAVTWAIRWATTPGSLLFQSRWIVTSFNSETKTIMGLTFLLAACPQVVYHLSRAISSTTTSSTFSFLKSFYSVIYFYCGFYLGRMWREWKKSEGLPFGLQGLFCVTSRPLPRSSTVISFKFFLSVSLSLCSYVYIYIYIYIILYMGVESGSRIGLMRFFWGRLYIQYVFVKCILIYFMTKLHYLVS